MKTLFTSFLVMLGIVHQSGHAGSYKLLNQMGRSMPDTVPNFHRHQEKLLEKIELSIDEKIQAFELANEEEKIQLYQELLKEAELKKHILMYASGGQPCQDCR